MAIVDQTLTELVAPDLEQQPLCIAYPNMDVGFELKSKLLHLLPIFMGLTGEDTNKYLKEFHIVCFTMKLVGITKEQIKEHSPSHLVTVQRNDSIISL